MKMYIGYLLLILALCSAVFWGYQQIKDPPIIARTITPLPTPVKFEADEKEIARLINQWRIETNRKPFETNDVLCKYAEIRLGEVKIYFTHRGYEEKTDLIARDGGFSATGENLAQDMKSNDEYLKKWLLSTSHRKNLEYPYTQTCLKCSGTYCVQLFAKY